MAEIGGLFQVLYLIFLGISYPSVSKQYFEKITNTIYNFDDDDKENINDKSLKNISMNISDKSCIFNDEREIKKNLVFDKRLAKEWASFPLNLIKKQESKNKETTRKKNLEFVKFLTIIAENKNN